MGAAYKQKGDLDAAADCCRRIFEISPIAHEAHNNLGIILAEQGKIEEAVAEVRRGLEAYPDYAEGWNTLGQLLHEQGNVTDELVCYQRAMASNIQEPAYHGQLANALLMQGRVAESISIHQRTVALAPGNAQAHSNLLFALNCSPAHSARDIYEAHLEWARRHANTVGKLTDHPGDRNPDRPIRVGYVSHDLRRHPVGTFLEPVLAHHDPNQVEIFCYSDTHKADEVTDRLRALSVQWRDTATVSDAQLCSMIREDRIDILVDLSGHTAGNRLLVFARKPAPIQVSWLGYPNTTGMSEIDFRLTDANADPPRMTERFHTETLVRLPEVFLCFAAPDLATEVEPAPALRNGYVTFGSFASLSKLNDPLIKLWARILQSIPRSRLILKSLGLGDAQLRTQFIERFGAQKIFAERLEFRPLDPLPEQHYRSFADIDITLDTYPYNGTTTTCESLWMGVPVVTRTGESHRSRVGSSLLETVGLTTQIASTDDEYVEAAVNLTKDPASLDALRLSLREKMRQSPLMNATKFTSDLEREYRAIWQRWCGSGSA
jgi:predicted O-linked N-acetylglucosamine transferase (SPINDLY family)